MYELLMTFVRYIMIYIGLDLVAAGVIDKSMVDALAGAGVTLFAIVWMLFTKGYMGKLKNWIKGLWAGSST